MYYKVHPEHSHITVFSMHGIDVGHIAHINNKYSVVIYFSDIAKDKDFDTSDEATAYVEENVTRDTLSSRMPIEDFGEAMKIPKLKEVIFTLVAGKEMNWLQRGIVTSIMNEFEPCCPKCASYDIKEMGKLIWCADCEEHYSKE